MTSSGISPLKKLNLSNFEPFLEIPLRIALALLFAHFLHKIEGWDPQNPRLLENMAFSRIFLKKLLHYNPHHPILFPYILL